MGVTEQYLKIREIASSPNHRELYNMKPGQALICIDESYFTCILWAQIIGNVGFYAAVPMMHSKNQIQAENEVYEEIHGRARHF